MTINIKDDHGKTIAIVTPDPASSDNTPVGGWDALRNIFKPR